MGSKLASLLLMLLATAAAAAHGQTVRVDGPAFTIDVPQGYRLSDPWTKEYPRTIAYAYDLNYDNHAVNVSVHYSDARPGIDFDDCAGNAADEDSMNDSALKAHFDLATTVVTRGYATIAGMTARSATVVNGVEKRAGKTETMTVRSVCLHNRLWTVDFRSLVGEPSSLSLDQGNTILDSIKAK